MYLLASEGMAALYENPCNSSTHFLIPRAALGAKKAPMLIVVGSGLELDCKSHNIPYYAYDTGMAVMNLVLQAEHMGLKTRQMAGWGSKQMKEAVAFPKGIEVLTVVALGKGSESRNLKEKLMSTAKEKLIKARTRKPLSKNFFVGFFGNKGKL